MAKTLILKNNIPEQRKRAVELFDQYLDLANKIWNAVLRLIVTLSSSGLILTVALVDKLFPISLCTGKLPLFLIISWILFFISIIFGIIAGINESIFFMNLASEHAETIKECNKKISQGLFLETFREDKLTKYIVSSNVVWGVISINSFILAIIFLCVVFLQRYILAAAWYTVIISVLFLFGLNYYLLNKRYKN